MLTIACDNDLIESNEVQTQKIFGTSELISSKLGVELDLSCFNGFSDLLTRTEEIACHDSVPKISLVSYNQINTIYLGNPCWENYLCILIKARNVIRIDTDSVYKNFESFPISRLENVLMKDLKNHNNNYSYAEKPEKLLISISVEDDKLNKLPETLTKLLESYEKITGRTDLNIWLEEHYKPIPPPPPPPPFPLSLTE